MADNNYILETRNLVKEFKGFVAVDDVSIKVQRGQIHALIGPNGAGKTTFFNLLTKFLIPTRGQILFNGEDITSEQPAQTARRGIVRSFQISATFPHLSVLENVRIGLQRAMGNSFHFWKSERSLDVLNKRAMELLETVGLTEFANYVTVELPYGRKRALEGPPARVRELGGEERGVERRVQEDRLPGHPPERAEQLLGLVDEALALLGTRRADLGREVEVPEVLDERRPGGRVVVEEGRDAETGVGEGGADDPPALLGGGARGRVEDEDDRGPAVRGEPEVAPLADVARQRGGRAGGGESETRARGGKPRALVDGFGCGHAFPGSCSMSSTLRIFW